MKKWIYILVALVVFNSHGFAQVFHFADSSTTIIKTTAQSPAHWYLEIYNDIGVDYPLRWKTHFFNIPAAWNINFDTQAGYFDPVLDGDSADFMLLDSLSFPQKLIIGAATNNTPGHGSVFMDIYDPLNPAGMVTIEYEFIITSVAAGIGEEETEIFFSIHHGYIEFLSSMDEFSVYSVSGQLLRSGDGNSTGCNILALSSGLYFLHVRKGQTFYTAKFSR